MNKPNCSNDYALGYTVLARFGASTLKFISNFGAKFGVSRLRIKLKLGWDYCKTGSLGHIEFYSLGHIEFYSLGRIEYYSLERIEY